MAQLNVCDHHHTSPALADRAVVSELDAASDRCERVQEKLTPGRRRVLELLLKAGRPAKAYDLIAQFGEDGKPAKPPTVYRALEFLERQGLAHRIESLNAYVACRHGDRPHVAAFLICDCCHTSREVETDGPADLLAVGERSGFRLQGVTIEGHGLCAECAPLA
jgi:Fur family transcriptional regulator, zinc uptake regulator